MMFEMIVIFIKKMTTRLLHYFKSVEICFFIVWFWLSVEIWPFSAHLMNFVECVRFSVRVVFCIMLTHFSICIYKLFKMKYYEYKNKSKIIKSLDHLCSEEEYIISAMAKKNKNNTSDFGSKHTNSLDRLYELGILCNRDIKEYSILEAELYFPQECIDFPEEYSLIRNYKMQDFIWKKVKNDSKWTTNSITQSDEDDSPF